MLKKRYVLLDRDGTICEEEKYLSDPKGVKLIPGAIKGLRLMQEAGFGLVIVTNQSGVGRGYFTLNDMNAVNQEVLNQLRKGGVEIDGIYSCPHAPDDDCSCRKPKPGMILKAADELGFDPVESIVIGDKEVDVNLGIAVGATSYLVLTGHGKSELSRMSKSPENVAEDLYEAAQSIVKSLG